MPSLLLYGLVALALLGAFSGIAYKIHDAGYQQARAECEQAARAQRELEEKQATKAAVRKEKGDAKARIVFRTIREEVERVVEKPVYVDRPCLDDAGLRLARDAIAGRTSSNPAVVDRAVPAPAPAVGRDSKGSTPLDR